MKLVVAFDKFKGSVTARQLNDAVAQVCHGITVVPVAVADGGDGTVEALAAGREGEWVTTVVTAFLPDARDVNARYFVTPDATAWMELATASGLALLGNSKRRVLYANTWGTGMMIADAVERGCRHVVLGLGGSATCDAGMGLLAALGVEFDDAQGRLLRPCGASLERVAVIDPSGVQQAVLDTRLTLLADVSNPLCGDLGAARVYAPQKGATLRQVEQLERGLQHIASLLSPDLTNMEGAGAAGGVAPLVCHLLNGELVHGADYVLQQNGFEQALADADLVITGEGRLDATSMMGKATGTVARMAAKHGVPVVAICGSVEPKFEASMAGFAQAIDLSVGASSELVMNQADTIARLQQAVVAVIKKISS